MKKILITLLFTILSQTCFGAIYIRPTKYDYQEEIYINGAPMILSHKENSILMYQTCTKVTNNRANFFFALTNRLEKPVNLLFHNVTVTDQWGRPIRVVHKSELISEKRRQKNWGLFSSALLAGIETSNADKAGEVRVKETKTTQSISSDRTRAAGNRTTVVASTTETRAKIQSEALRRQALTDVAINAQVRDDRILDTYDSWKHGLTNYYFDSTTLFPGMEYSANLQIDIPKKIQEDLQYLIFTYDINGEKHSFCYQCGR